MKKALPNLQLLELIFKRKATRHTLPILAILLSTHLAYGQLSVTLQAQSPLCGGFSTGQLLAIPVGGTAPYSYLWSNGSTNNPITNLPAGTYTVTVTDDVGATATATGILTEPPPLIVEITVNTCDLPGSLTANASGGSSPYMYMWANGETTQTISGLSPGEYCITVMDANSCGYVTCEYIGTPISLDVSTTSVDCSTGSGGTASVSTTGGVAPFDIEWSNGESTPTIENLAPGTYQVTVTAYNGCTAMGSGTVGILPGNFNINLDVTQPTCAGSSTGQITASTTGGTSPYSYLWSNGGNTATISNLPAGSYTVTVTDAIGCTSTESTTLIYLSSISLTVNGQNPTCAGANNGSVTAFPANGVTPYSYLWNTGSTSSSLTNVGAGTYTVTVTDAIGCTATDSHTLTAPAGFTVNVSTTNASHCGATDGSVSASLTGTGAPPFSYLWSNGATSNVVNNIAAGTYTVTVTSNQGCTATGQATVGQPMDLDIDISGSNFVCGNDNDGSLTASVTYGNPPFNFAWSNGGNTQTISNLAAGFYTVTVTSVEGCTGTATANISGSPAINLTFATQNVTCFSFSNGQVTANAAGGIAPLSYLWSTGSNSPSIFNLTAGTYTVTVTDAVGCTRTETASVMQPNALQITFNASPGSCGTNGFVEANVTGGTPTYNFLWSNGGTTSGIFGLAPGNYTVTVTDANGCMANATANVPAYPALLIDVTATNTTCNGTSDGTVTANVTNGDGPFSYLWNNGSTQATQTGLNPGNYSVTVTDVHGCMAFGSASVFLGAGLNVTIDAPTYVCPGTLVSATANASGGTPNYSYLWSNGQTTMTATGLAPGTYSVTVTDPSNCSGSASVNLLPGGNFDVVVNSENVGCNGNSTGSISLDVTGSNPPFEYLWNTGATSSSLQNLPAGTYSVTVTDQTECTKVETIEIAEPTALSVGVNALDGTCGDLGSAGANVNGGTAPHTFLWSNGSTQPAISNLPAGTYSVTVTDANDCTATASAQVDVIPAPSCEVNLAQPISAINGSDGQLTAEVTGGNAPFNYAWSNGGASQTISNLPAGTYSVTVTDADGCTTTCSFELLNPAKLGDFVWLDVDMDGVQDAGETGLQGVDVTLSGADDYGSTVLSTATTDATGMYMFLVQPGTYKLTFDPPTGYDNSPQNAGADDSVDSDVNPQTNMTPNYTIGAGETNLTIDAGYFESPCENVTDAGTICCDQTLCGPGLVPGPLTETSPPIGGEGMLEYLWMYSNEPGPFNPNTWYAIPTATSPGYAPGALGETTYFVRCVRREGCTDFLETNIVTITVDDVAVAEIDGPNSTCVGDPVDFSATANASGATYTWNFQDGDPATANTQNVGGVVWNSWGVKMVTLSVENAGCTSYDTLLISVSNSPTFCGSALVINAELTGQSNVVVDWDMLANDAAGLEFNVEWALNDGDFQALGEIDSMWLVGDRLHFAKQHVALRGLNRYRLSVTDALGGISYSNIEEIKITGDFSLVHVYPNPFSDKLQVEIIDRFDAEITLELMDAWGRQVGTYVAPTDEDVMTIPTADLLSGTYFLFVRYNNKPQKIFKLIK